MLNVITSYSIHYTKLYEKKQGFAVIYAKNGLEAVEIFSHRADEVQLILMDLKMPQMNGIEAIKHIRGINKEIPIIVQTAFTLNEDKVAAIDAGCTDFIEKPINRKHLLELIYDLLEN